MPGLEGTTLGRYLLKERLGQGGMSEVYLAYDEHMNRDVAIKVVSTSRQEYIERFYREAEAIGRFQHDHILPAYDYGEQENWHYLVMPYIAHGTLRDRLLQGRLSLQEAEEMLCQIASGLEYAHAQGIIHRDIKPSNILLRDDHHAYLADFGLAKILGNSDERNLTQTGALMGTAEYMAPELSEEPASTSSDMYALGILLYEMVTGRVPFSAETPMAVYWKQLREQPLPPSRLLPDLPHSIEQVILRALEKDPGKRYQRADALAQAYVQALRTATPQAAEMMQERYALDNAPYGEENLAAFAGVSSVPGLAERFVLPVHSLDAPFAVPATKDRWRVRQRLSSSFQRPRKRQVEREPMPPLEPLQQTPIPQVTDYGHLYQAEVPQPRSHGRVHRIPRPIHHVKIAANVGFGFLLAVILLMSLGFYLYQANGQHQGGVVVTSQANAISTAQGKTTAVPSTQVAQAIGITNASLLLNDSLSHNTEGRWPEADTVCAFTDGAYHVLVNQPNYLQSCLSNTLSYGNIAIQVNVTLLSGNDTGIMLRAHNDQFYTFEVNHQGQFYFRRHDTSNGSNFVYLIPATASSVIATNGQKNTLFVIAAGADFKLYINGSFVGATHDGSYANGAIGFTAGTLNQPASGAASFANLNIYKV